MKSIHASLFMFAIVFATIAGCKAQQVTTNKLYSDVPDEKEKKFLLGIISVSDITQDTSFAWYKENLKYYRNNADLVKMLSEKRGQFQMVLFTGTWCHDSQQVIPKYISCMQAAFFPDSCITIIATDRDKKTIANLHDVFNVHLVPTMIIMKGGKEFGRIEEYGSTGLPDQELADLLKGL